MKPLYFLLGWGFFGLGAVGTVVPGLPTTPFMLLALWAFSRSSKKFHDWLYAHKLFGPPLNQWRTHRIIPVKVKLLAIVTMATSFTYLAFFTGVTILVKFTVAFFMSCGAVFILSQPSRVSGSKRIGDNIANKDPEPGPRGEHMLSSQHQFETATALIDAANAEDPNEESDSGKMCPKELLYSHRMSDMLERYSPQADDAMKLAMRAQHIQRWKSPRDAFPMNRQGYHKWRSELYNFHAETAASLLIQAGYSEEIIERVKKAVGKRELKTNPDTQLVEDVAALVFIEHYMLEFEAKHPEYDEEKWLHIIRRTWNKMTEQGQKFALSGALKLPKPLIPVIQKAVAK